MMYKKKISLEFKIAFTITLVFLITAFFSDGWYFVDEQWQIIEFMSYKLGITKSSDLTWEFHDKIRPWLQPGIYYLISKISFTTNPFINAKIFRIFGIFLFLSSYFYLLRNLKIFYNEKIYFILFIGIGFFWAIPYFAARTSSENYSQIFCLFAFAVCLNSFKKPINLDTKLQVNSSLNTYTNNMIDINQIFQAKKYDKSLTFLSGFIWGLSFEFRYQTILLFIGSSLWFFLNAQKKFKFLFYIGSGFLLTIFLCIFIDYWGYSSFTFTPFNYFYQNIVLKKADSFGTSPFFGYIYEPLTQALIYIYIIYLIVIFKHWKNIFIFSTFPFYFIHLLIGHKEGRFLLPALVLTLIPVIHLSYVFLSQENRFEKLISRSPAKIFIFLICISNVLIIIYNMFSSPRIINLEKYLYDNNIKNQEIFTYGNFYKLPKYYDSNTYITYKNIKNDIFYIIFSQTFDEKSEKINDYTNKNCQILFNDFIIPDSLLNRFFIFRLPLKHSSNKRLFKCNKKIDFEKL